MGRIPTILSLFLSFLIILLHTNILTAYSQQLVLDTNGDFVQPGVDYYIQPLSARGTIGLSSAPNGTCPLDVVLQPDITKNASIPVTFTPFNATDNFISIGTSTNIEFSASTICNTSTVWRIQPSTNATATSYFVTIGGVKGDRPRPGIINRRGLNSWFTIESSELGRYVINICPSPTAVCNTCSPPTCGNIGLINEDGRTRLGITSPPLQVSFVRTRL